MANPKSLRVSNPVYGEGAGMEVTYVKSRRAISFSGWFDHFVGIEGVEMPLGQFLQELGITETDVRKELATK